MTTINLRKACLLTAISLMTMRAWECYAGERRCQTNEISMIAGTAKGDDRSAVEALDTAYQIAVKNNDVTTMDRILANNFILVTGTGKAYTKTDIIRDAQSSRFRYEHNEEKTRDVRVWGDTAIVTAELWEKGTESGTAFEHVFWFSDTYVRTPLGWRYVFGQSAYCPCRKLP